MNILLKPSICTGFLYLLILLNNIPQRYSAPITTNPKIVIIGAGSSGIAAAVKLLDYGFQDVTILEAEPRIGGRIHTIPFADNVVDLGAQWCHGEKNNVVYELAKNQNLFGSTMELYKNITFIRSIREKVPDSILEPLSILLDGIMSKRRNNTRRIPTSLSAHDFLKKEFDEALARPEYKHIDKEIAAEVLLSREYDECTLESSDDLSVIPAKGDREYEECEGDQTLNWKDKGYKTILNILMKTDELEKEYGVLEDRIKLSKRVKHIDWKRNDNKVMINCEDGEDILADHVIITVSIGVLKAQHTTLFEPALSVKKQVAIKEIDFGSVSKIFLEFDRAWWPDYWTGFTILWTKKDRESMRGTKKFWWEGVYGFYAVDNQERVLEVWLIGPSARHMETLSKDEIRSDCVELIKRFLGWEIPDPVNIVTTNWFTNPNFRGTYSYHSINMLNTEITPRELEEPLTVTILNCVKGYEDPENYCDIPIVQFAGEATNVAHYSTVHGAIETGWREATRLAKFYGSYINVPFAPMNTDPKIVIIGAGSSGIAAAVKLLDYGFQDITILEAEPRIGGRIHTIPFADNVVDLGAQWCYGERNNVVYELAKDRNLFSSTKKFSKNVFVRSNSDKVPDRIIEPLSILLEEIMSKRKNNSIPTNFSAHDFLKKEFDEALARSKYKRIDKEIAAEVLLSREYEECSLESSDDLSVIPAKGDREYKQCEGDQTLNWKDKGYKKILNILMKTDELGKEFGLLEDHIRLSKKMDYIDWKLNGNKIMIHCEDGEEILADHVIITVSVGVLKEQHGNLFEPALPDKKLAAIKEIDFGSVGKIFLEFEWAWWTDYWNGFTILWTKEDREDMRNTDKSWWLGISGFYAVDYQEPLLEVRLIGPFARHMETLSEDRIKADCVKLLRRFLGLVIPDPVNLVRTNWFTNPNFRGSYSYHSINMLETGITPRDLENPLTVNIFNCIKGNEDPENYCNKPIVQFAGEATSVHHYSTVHGAIETGWREATRLAKFYGMNTKVNSAPTITNPKIVIIGAGSSGIAAAVKLLDYGFQDITILEAEPRIGGRIHTIPFADNVVDLGAQWCYGEKKNVVYELANDRNLFSSTKEFSKNVFIRSIREKVPDSISKPLSILLDEIMSKRMNNSISTNFSAHDFLKKEFDEALARPEYKHIDKQIAAEVLLSREYEECFLKSSDDLSVIPANGDREYEECEGDQTLNWKDKGYKTILNILMKSDELGNENGVLEDHIRLSKRVKHINWKWYDNKVMIDCEDGEDILADHVIITVSIGVLKEEHSKLFEPPLSVKKQAAIKEIDFGSISKIFLEFEWAWWTDNWNGFTILWTKEDREDMRNTDKSWWLGISGFYAVDYQEPLLEVRLIGPFARHMETLSEDKIKAECVKLLRRCLGLVIPDPVNLVRTNWFTNPNFRGSYSYHSINMLETGITTRDLKKPLTVTVWDCIKGKYNCDKPLVQFAGEATSEHHYSTVHGAIETGWREAKRLAEFYGKNSV